ncbi:CHAD domain-containing protein [Mycobacterium sp. 4D054]|uniref:CHAD domain-containing protein n=1 Tax=unclassified Mycobacterium TaxID=2642494 RepID=UPI0021B2F444|nr:CHAD domain-containing protein [Mycobacterium sp. SMC-8]UXA14547.1 CHAD domain-containing protein [Mycobacterium sp. SMC-8]
MPARTPLHGYLTEQAGLVLDGMAGLRDGTDPIHDTRVAIRRVRSTIRVFGKALDDDAGALEDDLKWFAGVLGEVRDPQVQRRRLRAAVAELPDELVLGRVSGRIKRDLRGVEAPARRRVTEAMATARFEHLVGELQRWREAPPVQSKVGAKVLRKRARRAGAKADRRLQEALDGADDALLHRARKAAKRARYATELIELDDPSTRNKRNKKRYKRIQSVLGDLQDTVVARPMLRQMGAQAGTRSGENGFTFGLLYGREEQLARQCRRAVAQL